MRRPPPFGPLPGGAPDLEAVARAAVPALGALLVAHAERLVAGGVTADGRDVVVKVDRDLDGHRRETAALATLATGGVAVPEVVSVAEVDDPPAGVLVLGRVPGDPLGEYGDEDERFGAESWAAVGAALAQVHACPVVPPGPAMGGHTEPSFAAHLRSWGETNRHQGVAQGWLGADEAARHEELVAGLADRVADRPEVLVHGDCSPQHWLIDPSDGQVGLIDLGDAGMGDPAYDLVVLTLTQPHRREVVLAGYGADASLRAHLDATTPGYRALRLAGEICWLVDHGFDPSPSLARLRAALG